MSETNESEVQAVKESPAKGKSQPITMSQESLLELIAKMNDASTEKLVSALIESRKPYTDPKQEQNEEFMRQQAREQRKREEASRKYEQSNCPHTAGCNSLSDQLDLHNRTCIVWHTSDSTETFGICSNCQRIFRENDSDYAEWRRKPCINKQSKAGERTYANPMRARQIARGELVTS